MPDWAFDTAVHGSLEVVVELLVVVEFDEPVVVELPEPVVVELPEPVYVELPDPVVVVLPVVDELPSLLPPSPLPLSFCRRAGRTHAPWSVTPPCAVQPGS